MVVAVTVVIVPVVIVPVVIVPVVIVVARVRVVMTLTHARASTTGGGGRTSAPAQGRSRQNEA